MDKSLTTPTLIRRSRMGTGIDYDLRDGKSKIVYAHDKFMYELNIVTDTKLTLASGHKLGKIIINNIPYTNISGETNSSGITLNNTDATPYLYFPAGKYTVYLDADTHSAGASMYMNASYEKVHALVNDSTIPYFRIPSNAYKYYYAYVMRPINRFSKYTGKSPNTSVTPDEEVCGYMLNATMFKAGCRRIDSLSKEPPRLSDKITAAAEAFINRGGVIYVPTGCSNAYKTAKNWSLLESCIQECEFIIAPTITVNADIEVLSIGQTAATTGYQHFNKNFSAIVNTSDAVKTLTFTSEALVDDVRITCVGDNFLIKTEDGDYASSLIIDKDDALASDITITVKYTAPSTVGTQTGYILFESNGALPEIIQLSGTSTAAPSQ